MCYSRMPVATIAKIFHQRRKYSPSLDPKISAPASTHSSRPFACVCVCVCVYECVYFLLSVSLCASPLRTRDTTQADLEFERSSLLLKQEEEGKKPRLGKCIRDTISFSVSSLSLVGCDQILARRRSPSAVTASHRLPGFLLSLSPTPALGFGRTELLSHTAALGFGRMERLNARRVRALKKSRGAWMPTLVGWMKFEHYSFIRIQTKMFLIPNFSSSFTLKESTFRD